jgi:hypothetical protein
MRIAGLKGICLLIIPQNARQLASSGAFDSPDDASCQMTIILSELAKATLGQTSFNDEEATSCTDIASFSTFETNG